MAMPNIGNLGNIGAKPIDTGQVAQQQEQTPTLAGYKAGETVSAQVTGTSQDAIILQMPNGSEVEAQFPPDIAVSTGDQVQLTIVNKGPDTGTLQVQLNSVNGQSVNLESSHLEVYLMDQGIPPSPMNEAAAQVLIRNQITPTPKNVANLVEVATNLPEVPTNIAVLMAENSIPPTQQNAEILMKWSSGPATMGQEVADLGQAVAQAGGLPEFADNLSANITQTVAGQENPPVQPQTILDAPGFQQLANQLASAEGNNNPTQVQQAVQDFVSTLHLEPEQQQAAQTMILDAYEATTGEQIPREGAQNTPQAAQTAPQTEQAQQNVQTQQPAQEAQNAPQAEQAQQGAPQTEQAPQNTQTQQTTQQVQTAPQTEQTPQNTQTQQAEQAPREAPQPIKAEAEPAKKQGPRQVFIPEQNETAPQNVRSEAAQVVHTLGKMVARMRTGQPQADGKELQDSIKEQRVATETTRAAVTRMMGEHAPTTQRANQLSAEVRLGNQMDQFYYAQVPFQTLQQEGTAELFVFKRNPQKGEAERTQTTVLIGLDTEHMGRVESVLRSLDDKLSVQFRVATARIQRYFEDAIRSFRADMHNEGYTLDKVEVSMLKEKTTPLNAMKVLAPDSAPVRLQGLDIEV